MKRITGLSICLAVLILTACAKEPSVTNPTPASGTAVASPTAGSALGGFSSTGEPTAATTETPATTYTVQRGTIEDILRFNGQVAPVQIPMSFAQDGVIKKIFVQPGQTIKEGDLIAQLDIEDLETQLVEAQLATAQAQQAINQAAQTGQLEVQQAQIALEAAQQDLEQAKEPPSAVEVAQARATVREAEANLATIHNNASQAKNQAKADMDKAVINLQNIQKLYGETVIKLQKAEGEEAKTLQEKLDELQKQMVEAEAAVATAVINYDTARNNETAAVSDAEAKLELAKAQLNEVLKGADKFVIAEKERAVRSAEIALVQARQRVQADPALENAVENGRLKIKQIEAQIEDRQLIAPISGDIVAINVTAGEPIEIGSAVITIIDRNRLEIVTNSEDMLTEDRTSLPDFTPSQAVEITFSRYPGKTFSGSISLTPAIITDPESEVTDGTYHFVFDPQGRSFAAGDLADLTIMLSRKYDALYLPPAAIQTTRNRSRVLLQADGTESNVDIEIGLITPDKVEILSGLKEGDVVVGKE